MVAYGYESIDNVISYQSYGIQLEIGLDHVSLEAIEREEIMIIEKHPRKVHQGLHVVPHSYNIFYLLVSSVFLCVLSLSKSVIKHQSS